MLKKYKGEENRSDEGNVIDTNYSMRSSTLFAVLCVIAFASAAQALPSYHVHYYNQTVDHFNAESNAGRTFKQRYVVVTDYWKPRSTPFGGPLFYYTGNEGDIFSFFNNTGLMFDIAPQFGALIVFGEHRYYGESLPFGAVDSFKRENVGYLSMQQALADHASLITYLKETMPGLDTAPVVTFGGSYGGELSAWIRTKYPNVVDAALAASAPVTLSGNPNPKPSFFDIVTSDFAVEDKRCPDLVRQAFVALEKASLDEISSVFGMCTPLNSSSQMDHVQMWIVNSFANVAMVDYPYPASFLANLPAWPMRYGCQLMLNASTPLEGLAAFTRLFYLGSNPLLDAEEGAKCVDPFAEYIICADPTGCGTGPDGMAWDYQACTDFLNYPSCNNVTDMFPPRKWTLEQLNDYCSKTWGVTPRPAELKLEYSVDMIKAASNILLSNGGLDPWHSGGVLESLNPSVIAIVIPDGAHHLDLRSSNPADPYDVVVAREQEVMYLKEWIVDAYKQKLGNSKKLVNQSAL